MKTDIAKQEMLRTIERLLVALGELVFLMRLEVDDLLRMLVVIRARIEQKAQAFTERRT